MRHSFYCVFNFFTIIKFFINNLTTVFVPFMVTFHIKSFSIGTHTTSLTWKFVWIVSLEIQKKFLIKFSIYSFPIGSRVFNIDSFAIPKLWQALQNASLQYLQLTIFDAKIDRMSFDNILTLIFRQGFLFEIFEFFFYCQSWTFPSIKPKSNKFFDWNFF